jgi:hypothetical protein
MCFLKTKNPVGRKREPGDSRLAAFVARPQAEQIGAAG